MGRGMAQNLLAAGFDVTVWNRTAAKADALVEQGATRADTPAAAVMGADAVLYCLANAPAIERVVFGDDGVVTAVEAGQAVADMSTVHPDTTRKQAKAYAEKGADFVSAPVFGSKGEAANGGLWIVVGGPEATVDRLRPALEAMSASVHHMGAAVEAGTSMKLVGNALVASMIEGLGEALLLAKKAGLDLDQVRDVIGETDFRSPLFDGVGAAMTERRFEPSFALRHMLKDANLINRLAKDLNTPAPVASAARETLKAAVNQGWGDEDAAALVKALEQDAGVTLDGTTQ